MRKELLTYKNETFYSFVYYNSYEKKRIRLGREYIQLRFGKDITDPDEADDVMVILEKELKTLGTEKDRRMKLSKDQYEFQNLLNLFTDHQRKTAPNSFKNNTTWLKYYVLPYFLNIKQCENLDAWSLYYDDFKDWLETSAFLLKKPEQLLSFASKNHTIAALNTFMKHMHRKRFLANFISCESFPRHKMNEKTIDDIVSEQEMEEIYQQLHLEGNRLLAVFFRLLYFSGMRFSEACGVSLADIFEGEIEDETFQQRLRQHQIQYFGYIVIDSQPARRKAQAQDPETLRVPRKPLKGRNKIDEKSARIIPVIDRVLWNDLVKLYNQTLKQFDKKVWGSNQKDYILFPGVSSTSGTELLRCYKRLKLKHRSWHCLRHTRATLLVGKTGDFMLTRMWLGHKSQAVLERYTHVYQSIVRNAKKHKDRQLQPLREDTK